jgi:hypothetical protein
MSHIVTIRTEVRDAADIAVFDGHVFVVAVGAAEVIRPGKLLMIADNDGLLALGDGADASQVAICDASSETTTSNCVQPQGRYCAIDSGDIRRQGASFPNASGMPEITSRIDLLGRFSPI